MGKKKGTGKRRKKQRQKELKRQLKDAGLAALVAFVRSLRTNTDRNPTPKPQLEE